MEDYFPFRDQLKYSKVKRESLGDKFNEENKKIRLKVLRTNPGASICKLFVKFDRNFC